jgi:ribosomal protein L16/L10AE
MGKGKGSFDHWASRIAVSKVIFELKGDIHEQVARDAFRLAGNKMPGGFEHPRFHSINTNSGCYRYV